MDDRKRKAEPLPQEARKRSRLDDGHEQHASVSGAENGAAHNTATPSPADTGVSMSLIEQAKRAALLRAQAVTGKPVVSSSLPSQEGETAASSGKQLGGSKKTVLAPALVLDASGKVVPDVLSIPVQRVTTLKINDPSRVAPPKSATIIAGIPSKLSGPASEAAAYNPYLAHRKVEAAPAPVVEPVVEPAQSGELLLTKVSQPQHASKPHTSDITVGMDPRLPALDPEKKRHLRARKALQFAEQGKFVQQAEELRERATKFAEIAAFREKGSRMRPAFHHELEDENPQTGAADLATLETENQVAESKPQEPSILTLPPKHRGHILGKSASSALNPAGRVEVVPARVEWWDALFLSPERSAEFETYINAMRTHLVDKKGDAPALETPFSYQELDLRNQKTWQYVQHPVPIVSAADEEMNKPIPLKLMLTKREQKQQRRRLRAERHKELLDKQRMGLLPAPEPKVRLANLMRVLTDTAVADPSAVEARVRERQAQRVRNHEMRNAAKKLTPEERAEKWKTKMMHQGVHGPDCALLRVPSLRSKKVRSIIDLNAKGTYLTGVVLECRSVEYSLIYVEGGTRAIRKYLRLFQKRIKWHEASKPPAKDEDGEDEDAQESEDEEDDDAAFFNPQLQANGYGSGAGSKCELVWQGTVSKRHFEDFRFEATKTPAAAKKFLNNRGLGHLWDAVVLSAQHAGITGVSAEEPAGNKSEIHSLFTSGGFLQNPLFATSNTEDTVMAT